MKRILVPAVLAMAASSVALGQMAEDKSAPKGQGRTRVDKAGTRPRTGRCSRRHSISRTEYCGDYTFNNSSRSPYDGGSRSWRLSSLARLSCSRMTSMTCKCASMEIRLLAVLRKKGRLNVKTLAGNIDSREWYVGMGAGSWSPSSQLVSQNN
jgi:hypothetical protein